MKEIKKRVKKRPIFRFRKVKIGDRFHFHLPEFINPHLGILTGTILFIAFSLPFTSKVQIFDLPKVGEVAKETIISPITYDILRSMEEVERDRKKAAEQVLLVLDYDKNESINSIKRLDEIYSYLKNFAEKDTNVTVETIRAYVKELSESAIKILLKEPDIIKETEEYIREALNKGVSSVLLVPTMEKLTEMRRTYNTHFDQHLIYDKNFVTLRIDSTTEKSVRVSEVEVKEVVIENIVKQIRSGKKYNDEKLAVIYELLLSYLHPNVKVNGEETLNRRQKAILEVPLTKGKVLKDTEILRKHQEVTPEIVEKLRSLRIALDKISNVKERRRNMMGNISRILLVIIPLLFLAFYIKKYQKSLYYNYQHLIAFCSICCLQIILIRGSLILAARLLEGSNEMTYIVNEYLIPIVMGSILTSILFPIETSFLSTLFISIFFGVITGFNHYFFIYSLLGGIIASISSRNIRYRWHFFKIIPNVVGISIVVITLWHLIGLKISLASIFTNYGLSLISIITSVLFAMMLTPVFEHLFDITTNMTLVELSDLNHPILKRLSIEAAGTYNHSVLVGNLAESAALKIGANALFARVASYYHDIGKIEKADYFIENSITLDKSRHSKLTPSMSALIICSHVKEGVELAKKYRVPKSIQDVIMQHHGTSRVSFFYEKALEQD
ncbi:MAG: HDIG domain-containing protein, partial [Chitinispirillaceae bacterium]|nr:HDIG domain-containing protein [Chitinispirillaceae bacterium]